MFAPFLALTWAVSRTTRVTSMRPASSSRCSTASCSRPQTLALDQIRNRRWAVDFDMPKQGGSWRQAQPLTST
ncbi:hypothetical protein FM21_13025 [Streptomyces mutabilis]|uniref:Uncharacterized protein n=1 Tax=Streptomyces mutabilis TaxID=67332 RepID=A0A086N740_9ACTN|nr:hypothetical protein FM21_13025 [Streptomyces mutabilis]